VNAHPIEAFERCQKLIATDHRGIVPHLGLVSDDEVPRYFRAADVVILPFTGNTSSTSFMLSMSFEIPFISISNAFNRQVLSQRCGVYIETLDELPGAMEQIKKCDLAAMRREIAARKPSFSWDRAITDHIVVYSKVLNGESESGQR
jgi:glycosyltransferase involved in cell wall biosynthesis